MTASSLPPEVSADYQNVGVEGALEKLLDSPDYENLATLLNALSDGYLVVDVTGATGKKGTRIRTTRSTKGQLVLPVFTSMERLRSAKKSSGRQRTDTKGALMPSLEALRLIETDRFVAAEINPGSDPLVILRKYISLIISGERITAEALEAGL